MSANLSILKLRRKKFTDSYAKLKSLVPYEESAEIRRAIKSMLDDTDALLKELSNVLEEVEKDED